MVGRGSGCLRRFLGGYDAFCDASRRDVASPPNFPRPTSIFASSLVLTFPPASTTLSDDFDLHSRVSLRLVPLPSPPTTINPSTNLPYPPSLNPLDPYPSTPNSSITPNHSFSSQQQSHQPPSRPGSTEPGGQSSIGSGRDANKPDWSLGVRSIPCKVFLPEGAMVVQEVVSPFSGSGESPRYPFFYRAGDDERRRKTSLCRGELAADFLALLSLFDSSFDLKANQHPQPSALTSKPISLSSSLLPSLQPRRILTPSPSPSSRGSFLLRTPRWLGWERVS